MSAKLTCTAKHPETEVCTFVYTMGTRILNFTVPFKELDIWWKSVTTLDQITNAPFKTGPGLFDHPIISFCLYSLVMMVGGDEELVGAEYSVTAPKKVQS